MKIAVTDTMGSEHKFQKYIDWLKKENSTVSCEILSYKADNMSVLDDCDALLLTGGHDVDPQFYNGHTGHPKITEVDTQRDSFECKALEKALHDELPVLGICRGLQLANVVFGGTLITDIEEAGYRNHRNEKEVERTHDLIIENKSLLYDIVGTIVGTVNTSHHQAVDKLGNGLRVSARSADGIIEAFEYEHPQEHQFFMCVQWHPERMLDMNSPFTKMIIGKFLAAADMIQDKAHQGMRRA